MFNLYKYSMDEDNVRTVKYYDSNADLPFGDVFGNDLRTVIPIYDEVITKIRDMLTRGETKTGAKYNIDMENLVVYKEKDIQKKRPIKMGRIVGSELGKEYLDKFSRFADSLSSTEEKYYIIISRSPVDILRMSDFSGISSCHSRGESEFSSARQEAVDGGLIAYTIDEYEYRKIKDLQENEIFYDEERHVGNIKPISRIRLNRYTRTDEEIDFFAPSLKEYGERVSGALESLTAWAYNAQKDKLKNIEFQELKRRGGRYREVTDGEILNNLLNEPKFSHGICSHESQREDPGAMVEIGRRVEEINEGYDNEFISASGSVEEDYIYCSAMMSFEFNISEFVGDWLEKLKKNKRELEKIIKEALDKHSIYGELEIQCDIDQSEFRRIDIYISGTEIDGIEDFEQFMRDCNSITQEDYEAIMVEIQTNLINYGVLIDMVGKCADVLSRLELKNFNLYFNEIEIGDDKFSFYEYTHDEDGDTSIDNLNFTITTDNILCFKTNISGWLNNNETENAIKQEILTYIQEVSDYKIAEDNLVIAFTNDNSNRTFFNITMIFDSKVVKFESINEIKKLIHLFDTNLQSLLIRISPIVNKAIEETLLTYTKDILVSNPSFYKDLSEYLDEKDIQELETLYYKKISELVKLYHTNDESIISIYNLANPIYNKVFTKVLIDLLNDDNTANIVFGNIKFILEKFKKYINKNDYDSLVLSLKNKASIRSEDYISKFNILIQELNSEIKTINIISINQVLDSVSKFNTYLFDIMKIKYKETYIKLINMSNIESFNDLVSYAYFPNCFIGDTDVLKAVYNKWMVFSKNKENDYELHRLNYRIPIEIRTYIEQMAKYTNETKIDEVIDRPKNIQDDLQTQTEQSTETIQVDNKNKQAKLNWYSFFKNS